RNQVAHAKLLRGTRTAPATTATSVDWSNVYPFTFIPSTPPSARESRLMAEPEELARLFAQFGKEFGRRMCQEMGRAGTTPARARLLGALNFFGSGKMSEIGARLGVTPRNVTKLVDALEGEGLVQRKPHPDDRRATLLSLTERGAAVCRESAQ